MSREEAPQVPIKPPIVLALLLAAAAGLEFAFSLGDGPFGDGARRYFLGALIAACGIAVASTAARSFIGAGTTIMPDRPNAALVVTGLYRYSRNPMYIGLILIYGGLAAMIGGYWPLLLLPAFVYYLRYFAIGREEPYLKKRFGEPYLDYMAKTPRWF